MRKGVLLACAAAVLAGCGAFDRAAVRSEARVLERGRAATLDEPDYELAREASPAQLKLLETLIVSAPRDRRLRRLAAEGFGGAAFLFVEPTAPERAKGLYLRGRDEALSALALKPKFRGLDGDSLDAFRAAVAKAAKDDVPDLFWAAFDWAGWVNLSKDDAAALADLPKVEVLMARVRALDPGYHFDGADLFFGIDEASRPPLLGGDPAKAKADFDRARAATGDKYLMALVLEARWYAVAAQDKDLFVRLLKEVESAPAGRLPEARLTDEAAKRRAAALLEKTDDYF
ncbi:MAG: hypothetical protein KGM24_12540 [Elusimicrobia bacterium]|nr:hypothetical protein [Elusimicrobiota bacterium]